MADRPRILCVFGTRPEAIKMAPIVRALAAPSSGLEPVVCVTDQHREMLDQVLEFFAVTPDHRLGVMRAGQTPSEIAARVLERLPAVLDAVQPAAVLVQGDTTTTVAATLAAFHARLPSATSAGLRPLNGLPFRKRSPAGHRAGRWHFAPQCGRATISSTSTSRLAHRGYRNPVDAPCGRWSGWETARSPAVPPTGAAPDPGDRTPPGELRPPFLELCRALRELMGGNPEVESRIRSHKTGCGAGAPRARWALRIHLLPPSVQRAGRSAAPQPARLRTRGNQEGAVARQAGARAARHHRTGGHRGGAALLLIAAGVLAWPSMTAWSRRGR
jgi:hypothetical protein